MTLTVACLCAIGAPLWAAKRAKINQIQKRRTNTKRTKDKPTIKGHSSNQRTNTNKDRQKYTQTKNKFLTNEGHLVIKDQTTKTNRH